MTINLIILIGYNNKIKCPPHKDDNPMLKHFGNGFPDLYKTLEVFRITGGEPMAKDTFKVLDYIHDNPNPI